MDDSGVRREPFGDECHNAFTVCDSLGTIPGCFVSLFLVGEVSVDHDVVMLDVVVGVVDDSVIVSVCFLPAHYVWSLVDCVGVHLVGGLNVLSIDVVDNYEEGL